MLYVIVSEEGLRAIHIPGFPGSKISLSKLKTEIEASLCSCSCLKNGNGKKCEFYTKRGCEIEEDLLKSYLEIKNAAIKKYWHLRDCFS